jgi:cytochrome oxidase assembly protein ShyY1
VVPRSSSPVPLRTLLRTMREPRFAALSALMILVALICTAAGTWQVYRLDYKVRTNAELRHNAHQPPVPVGDILPFVGSGSRPPTHQIEFRQATATGSYDAPHQGLVRNRTLEGIPGYLVLTPFRTSQGTLLVVRGFAPAPKGGGLPAVPVAPQTPTTITVRIQAGESRDDAAAHLPAHQLESVNPSQQAARLGTPVYDGYGQLLAGQPGLGSLLAVPDPSLSNPAGGAVEPQHLAYVLQWFLFALLALAAPVVMARSELRDRAGHPADDLQAALEGNPVSDAAEPAPTASEVAQVEPSADESRAARLADRYGRARRT